MTSAIVIVLLGIAAAVSLWCTFGFMRAPNAFARLHYLTPVSTIATFAVTVALVLDGPGTSASIKAIVVFLVTALTSPITQYKIAHAMWVRERTNG